MSNDDLCPLCKLMSSKRRLIHYTAIGGGSFHVDGSFYDGFCSECVPDCTACKKPVRTAALQEYFDDLKGRSLGTCRWTSAF